MKRRLVHLLDSNVLIALAAPDHTLHRRARRWFQPGTRFATCPVTQGALLRFNLRFSPQPSIGAAKRLLDRIAALPGHEFWPDSVSYQEIPEAGVIGRRQVTDAYLVALANAHRGALATMDDALPAVHRNVILI
jgi:toxin-antitoxin system PIN domain toxin